MPYFFCTEFRRVEATKHRRKIQFDSQNVILFSKRLIFQKSILSNVDKTPVCSGKLQIRQLPVYLNYNLHIHTNGLSLNSHLFLQGFTFMSMEKSLPQEGM